MSFKLKRGALVMVLLIIIFIIASLIPIKTAVNYDSRAVVKQGNNHESVIICRNEQVTGATWAMIGNQNGLFNENNGEYVYIEGNTPEKDLDSSLLETSNRYIFYGRFVRNRTINGETSRVFQVSDWELIYPVKRYSIRSIFASDKYLNIFDIKWK